MRVYALAAARRPSHGERHDRPESGRSSCPGAVRRRGLRGEVSRRGWALFLAMSVIWGVPYLLIKVAVDEVSPVDRGVRALRRSARRCCCPGPSLGGSCARRCGTGERCCCSPLLEMAGPWLLLAYAEAVAVQLADRPAGGRRALRRRARRPAGRGGGAAHPGPDRRHGDGRRRHRGPARTGRRRGRSCCRWSPSRWWWSATRPAPLVVSRGAARGARRRGQLDRAVRHRRRLRAVRPAASWATSRTRPGRRWLSLVALGVLCTARGPRAVLRADPRGRPAARPGHHLREPGGGGAARRPPARRAVHPRHRASACRWCWRAACWPPGAARPPVRSRARRPPATPSAR